MEKLLQGTTPYLTISFEDTGLDVSDFSEAELTLKSGTAKVTKELSAMSVDTENNTLAYHFTETDTLSLSTTAAVYWQIYVKIGAEIFGTRAERVRIFDKIKGTVME